VIFPLPQRKLNAAYPFPSVSFYPDPSPVSLLNGRYHPFWLATFSSRLPLPSPLPVTLVLWVFPLFFFWRRRFILVEPPLPRNKGAFLVLWFGLLFSTPLAFSPPLPPLWVVQPPPKPRQQAYLVGPPQLIRFLRSAYFSQLSRSSPSPPFIGPSPHMRSQSLFPPRCLAVYRLFYSSDLIALIFFPGVRSASFL